MFNLFLFGTPRLESKGKAIEFDTRKAIALLAYLAVTRETYSRDTLAALLYPEYDQTHARASLQRPSADRRRALSLIARVIGQHDASIAVAAAELAWSPAEPGPQEVTAIVESVEQGAQQP